MDRPRATPYHRKKLGDPFVVQAWLRFPPHYTRLLIKLVEVMRDKGTANRQRILLGNVVSAIVMKYLEENAAWIERQHLELLSKQLGTDLGKRLTPEEAKALGSAADAYSPGADGPATSAFSSKFWDFQGAAKRAAGLVGDAAEDAEGL